MQKFNTHKSSAFSANFAMWLLFILGIIAISYCLLKVMAYHNNLLYFLNFDVSTYPNIGRNLVYQHGSLTAWYLGDAPYLFPEVAFFYLFAHVTANTYISLIVYMVMQVSLFIFAVISFFRTVVNNQHGLRLGMIYSLLFMLIFLLKKSFNAYGTKALFATVFLPGYHFAAALFCMFGLIVFIKLLKRDLLRWHLTLFLLIFLGGISDALVYVYFVAPMVICLFLLGALKELPIKTSFKFIAWIAIAAIASYVTYQLLPIHITKVHLSATIGIAYFLAYLKSIAMFFKTEAVLACLWLLFLIWAPISLWCSRNQKPFLSKPINFAILFQFCVVVVSTPVLIVVIGQVASAHLNDPSWQHFIKNSAKYYQSIVSFPFRYMVNYYLWPIFFGLPLLLFKHTQSILKLYRLRVFVAMMLLLIVALILIPPKHLQTQKLVGFHSELAQCFQQKAAEYHLSNGISNDFFSVNMLNANINTKHQIARVSKTTLKPIGWIDTAQRFKLRNYNFAYSPSLSFLQTVENKVGKPSQIFICQLQVAQTNPWHKTKYYFYAYDQWQLNNIFSH